MSDLRGGVAVVTGGAGGGSGLGRGLVRRLASEGMRVAILDLDVTSAEELAADLRSEGVEAIACAIDVTDTSTIRIAAAEVRETFGGCNVLCAHVGGEGLGRFEDLTEGQWLTAMQTMVIGTVATAQAFLPIMRETSGRRHIVLTSSVAALAPGRHQGAYRAAKAAVTSIGETLAYELGGEGITTTIAFPSGMQPAEALDSVRIVAGMTVDELTTLMGDPVMAVVAHEMAGDPADVISGDMAAQHIVDAVLADERYIITHGVSFERAYRDRAGLLDAALAKLRKRNPAP